MYEGPERRCEDCDNVRGTVNMHRGMFKILLGFVAVLIALSSYGVGVTNKLTPRMATAEAELKHIPTLIQKNDETSTSVIMLTEQLKYMTLSNQEVAKSVKILAEKIEDF